MRSGSACTCPKLFTNFRIRSKGKCRTDKHIKLSCSVVLLYHFWKNIYIEACLWRGHVLNNACCLCSNQAHAVNKPKQRDIVHSAAYKHFNLSHCKRGNPIPPSCSYQETSRAFRSDFHQKLQYLLFIVLLNPVIVTHKTRQLYVKCNWEDVLFLCPK